MIAKKQGKLPAGYGACMGTDTKADLAGLAGLNRAQEPQMWGDLMVSMRVNTLRPH